MRWDTFFNDIGFHKYASMLTSFRFTDVVFVSHAPHMLLSIYQLGGTAAVIEGAWKIEVAYQHETHPSPYPITEANFGDHLRKKE